MLSRVPFALAGLSCCLIRLADLGRSISINSAGEASETSYLFQRISVLVQRFNAVLLHESLPAADSTD